MHKVIFIVLCHLAAVEIGLLILTRALGVPDAITFTLFGMLLITTSYWLDMFLKQKKPNWYNKDIGNLYVKDDKGNVVPSKIKKTLFGKYSKWIFVTISFVITLIAYYFIGVFQPMQM